MNSWFLLEQFLLLLCVIKNYESTSTSNVTINDMNIKLDEEVKFFLYTRKNNGSTEQLWLNDTQSILLSTYDTKHSTKFVTHGWLGSKDSESCTLIRDAFLLHDCYNVIVIDWRNVTKLSLKKIVAHIPQISAQVAKMIEFLVHHGTNHNNISLVGHSMGALLTGSIGHQSKIKIGHLVGLDPPSPLRLAFLDKEISPERVRGISKDDAELVEIIYTLQGNSEVIGQVGHAEFYPNGGDKQPGCYINSNPNECPHNRAYFLYAEAITQSDGFVAIKCSDFETFLNGDCDNNNNNNNNNNIVRFPNWSTEKKQNGLFFLKTAGSSPFGLGLHGIKPNID